MVDVSLIREDRVNSHDGDQKYQVPSRLKHHPVVAGILQGGMLSAMIAKIDCIPAETTCAWSKVEAGVRWLAGVAAVAYALSWYDMLNIASGLSTSTAA
jgi:hypothetical protein